MGSTNIDIPSEFWPNINTEDDIEVLQRDIAQPTVLTIYIQILESRSLRNPE